jgi:hypothetical protein
LGRALPARSLPGAVRSARAAHPPRLLWGESGYGPTDIDVAQIYETATGMGVAAIIDHGFCTAEEPGAFLTFESSALIGSAETR